jgi:hypothetical protein
MMPSGSADAGQHVGAGAGPARRDRARHVAVGDQSDPGSDVPHILDQLGVPWPVQDAHRHVRNGQSLDLGDRADVLGDRRGDVENVGGIGTHGDLVHVEHRRRVEHRAAVGHREHCYGVGHALAHQCGAVDRVDGEIAVRAVAVADFFAVVEHRRVVFLAFADHDDAAHRHRVHQLADRVDRCAVTALLIAAAHPAACGHGARFGDPDQLEGEVAIRGFTTRTCGHGCRLSQRQVVARELGYSWCDHAARAGGQTG